MTNPPRVILSVSEESLYAHIWVGCVVFCCASNQWAALTSHPRISISLKPLDRGGPSLYPQSHEKLQVCSLQLAPASVGLLDRLRPREFCRRQAAHFLFSGQCDSSIPLGRARERHFRQARARRRTALYQQRHHEHRRVGGRERANRRRRAGVDRSAFARNQAHHPRQPAAVACVQSCGPSRYQSHSGSGRQIRRDLALRFIHRSRISLSVPEKRARSIAI